MNFSDFCHKNHFDKIISATMDNLSDLIGDKEQMDWLEDHRNKCKMPVIEEINAKEYDRYIQLF